MSSAMSETPPWPQGLGDVTTWRAAVDIGSVAAKLLLTDGTRRIRHSVDTMLGGMSLTATGEVRPEAISAEALARLECTLEEFRQLVEAQGATAIRAVATAAGRWASNAYTLTALVEQCLGTELEIIDGAGEARLAYLGALSDPRLVPAAGAAGGPRPVVTIDIGGGSTEFAMGTGLAPEYVYSIPIGGRSITAAYLWSDPPRPDELSAALSVIELHVDDVRRELPGLIASLETGVVLGLGAVTTVAAIEVGLADQDPNRGTGDGPLHGFELTREAVEDVFRTIATENRDDRAHNPGLPPSRVDEIVGAAAVLVETMRQLGLDQVVVSQRGLLDGVAAELATSQG